MLHVLMRVSVCRLHTGTQLQAISKPLLSKLRKKTGVSFIKCRDALEKFDNDLNKAEAWLKEQALKEGWTKATKLQNRPMSQGLIGLIVDHNEAAMIELNCETDYVARLSNFHKLVSTATNVILKHGKKVGQSKLLLDAASMKEVTDAEIQGSSLPDYIALEIGNVGENMQLRRAVYLNVADTMILGSYVHCAGATVPKDGTCKLGKYGSLVTFTQSEGSKDQLPAAIIAQNLGQHIVGMNPKTLGTMEDEETSDGLEMVDKESNTKEAKVSGDTVNHDSEATEPPTDGNTSGDENETRLFNQDFLLDDSVKVRDFLNMNSAFVDDFVRFEVGEILPTDAD